MEYFRNHESIIQEEINHVQLDEEVVNFDDELGREVEIELEIDHIA